MILIYMFYNFFLLQKKNKIKVIDTSIFIFGKCQNKSKLKKAPNCDVYYLLSQDFLLISDKYHFNGI